MKEGGSQETYLFSVIFYFIVYQKVFTKTGGKQQKLSDSLGLMNNADHIISKIQSDDIDIYIL